MITMKNVYKSFQVKEKDGFSNLFSRKKHTKEVIKGIDLNIPQGKIVGLLGINGAGKTTTIKMLATMLTPTSGNIFIDDIDIVEKPFLAKDKINLISGGERNLYWRLTATENLKYFGSLYGIKSAELNGRIDEILSTVDLVTAKDIAVEKYSKGMKQRLQIAKGLINNPKYLFLDEPTLGLDILIAKELKKYIKLLATKENKGILLTSHYIKEIEELCDYIYILDNGVIFAQGTPEEIKKQYEVSIKTRVTFDKLSDSFFNNLEKDSSIYSIKCLKDRQLVFEILSGTSILNKVIECAVKDKYTSILSIDVSDPTLEDVLLNLWGDSNVY